MSSVSFTAVDAGYDHNVALTAIGVYCRTSSRFSHDHMHVSLHIAHVHARVHMHVSVGGQLVVFGFNTDGRLGVGDYVHRSTPTLVSDQSTLSFAAVSASFLHTVAIMGTYFLILCIFRRYSNTILWHCTHQ